VYGTGPLKVEGRRSKKEFGSISRRGGRPAAFGADSMESNDWFESRCSRLPSVAFAAARAGKDRTSHSKICIIALHQNQRSRSTPSTVVLVVNIPSSPVIDCGELENEWHCRSFGTRGFVDSSHRVIVDSLDLVGLLQSIAASCQVSTMV
jgi:hypothetical protein